MTLARAGETAGALRERVGLGILHALVAVLLFSLMDALVRALSVKGYPTWQIVFCRSFFALIPVSILVTRQRAWRTLPTRRLGGHFLRAAVGLGSLYTFFLAFRYLPLADVVAIGFAAPLFVTALSVPLLGEQVGPHRWAAVLVGFAGVLLILRPDAARLADPGALIALVATLLYALALLLIRRLSRHETSLRLVFYFTVICTLASAVFALPQWRDPTSLVDGALMVATGLIGGSAQFFLTRAYSMAPAAVLAPFDYTALLYATSIGWIWFGEWPDTITFAGAGILIASGLYILWRETRR